MLCANIIVYQYIILKEARSLKYRILSIGSLSLERIEKLSRFPYTDEVMTSYDGTLCDEPGGSGGIAATVFKRLGGDSLVCGGIGIDDAGAELTELYGKVGIDTRFLAPDRAYPTGITSRRINPKGEEQTVIFPGANVSFNASDVENGFTSIPDAAFVSFDIPAQSIYAASKLAERKDIPLFVNATAENREVNIDDFSRIDVLIMSPEECYRLTGIKADTLENCLKACIRLASKKPIKYQIIKLERRGAFVYDNTLYNIIPSHKVDVSDRAGEADIFAASLSYALLHKKDDVLQAVRFAMLATAISVSKEGAALSAPTLAEVQKFAVKVKEAGRDEQ